MKIIWLILIFDADDDDDVAILCQCNFWLLITWGCWSCCCWCCCWFCCCCWSDLYETISVILWGEYGIPGREESHRRFILFPWVYLRSAWKRNVSVREMRPCTFDSKLVISPTSFDGACNKIKKKISTGIRLEYFCNKCLRLKLGNN